MSFLRGVNHDAMRRYPDTERRKVAFKYKHIRTGNLHVDNDEKRTRSLDE